MKSLSYQMQAAQQRSQQPAIRPGSVLSLLHPKPQACQQPDPQANRPQATQAQTIPQPHVICGATPCPACRSTWIIESYGPSGRTQCHGCKAERSQLGLFDYDVPALTAAAATLTNAAALTITQFIDAVIAAGYPQLAEMARKYQPTATQSTKDKTDEPQSI